MFPQDYFPADYFSPSYFPKADSMTPAQFTTALITAVSGMFGNSVAAGLLKAVLGSMAPLFQAAATPLLNQYTAAAQASAQTAAQSSLVSDMNTEINTAVSALNAPTASASS